MFRPLPRHRGFGVVAVLHIDVRLSPIDIVLAILQKLKSVQLVPVTDS